MRFLSTLLIGLVALSSPTEAARHSNSASNKLARLADRVVPTAVSGYTFNADFKDITGQKAGVKVPTGAPNLLISSNNARTNAVLVRKYSPSKLDSRIEIPVGLSSTYTVGVWVSWSGKGSASGENDIISATDGSFRLYIDSQGNVCAGYNGACVVKDPTVVPVSIWQHVTVTYAASSGTFTLYRNGVSVATGTSGGFNGATKLALLNRGINGADNGFVGSIDDLRIFSSVLDATTVNELYVATDYDSKAPVQTPTRWWGHTMTSQVQFASRTMGQPTGDIRVTGAFWDADFRPTNYLYIRLHGVKGASQTGVKVAGVGTVSFDAPTYILTLQPETKIPSQQTWDYTIPGSALNLNNPDFGNMASDSDTRWRMAIQLDKDQTNGRSQGPRWEGILYTPETINPNPSLLEQESEVVFIEAKEQTFGVTTDCSGRNWVESCASADCHTSKTTSNGLEVPCILTLSGTCKPAHVAMETCA